MIIKKNYGSVILWIILILILSVCSFSAYTIWIKPSPIRFPREVMLQDFQCPVDKESVGKLEELYERLDASTGKIMSLFEKEVYKPIWDDTQTIYYAVEAVEINDKQFPDRKNLNLIINECAQILGIKRPRVYIEDRPGLGAFTTNVNDPFIVIHSSLLRRHISDAELRFIIGHEMGHIKCHHVKWNIMFDLITTSLPEKAKGLLSLGVLELARKAEMSADNAGIICCQDIKVAEKALMRLLLNIEDDSIGKVDVNAFLEQKESTDISSYSEIMLFLKQLERTHPFIKDRIRQLREYEKSPRYQKLWIK